MTRHLELTTRVLLKQPWPADALPDVARRGAPPAVGNIATVT